MNEKTATTVAAPRGGLLRMSRRVMNLAYMLTQNARRLADRPGFIWAEQSWTCLLYTSDAADE